MPSLIVMEVAGWLFSNGYAGSDGGGVEAVALNDISCGSCIEGGHCGDGRGGLATEWIEWSLLLIKTLLLPLGKRRLQLCVDILVAIIQRCIYENITVFSDFPTQNMPARFVKWLIVDLDRGFTVAKRLELLGRHLILWRKDSWELVGSLREIDHASSCVDSGDQRIWIIHGMAHS